jgi:two-component sensor histidine kinase
MLLKEVDRRIKNNIASIINLINMQADMAANTEIKRALQNVITRVESMRIIYDRLLLSENFKEVSSKKNFEMLPQAIDGLFREKNIWK